MDIRVELVNEMLGGIKKVVSVKMIDFDVETMTPVLAKVTNSGTSLATLMRTGWSVVERECEYTFRLHTTATICDNKRKCDGYVWDTSFKAVSYEDAYQQLRKYLATIEDSKVYMVGVKKKNDNAIKFEKRIEVKCIAPEDTPCKHNNNNALKDTKWHVRFYAKDGTKLKTVQRGGRQVKQVVHNAGLTTAECNETFEGTLEEVQAYIRKVVTSDMNGWTDGYAEKVIA